MYHCLCNSLSYFVHHRSFAQDVKSEMQVLQRGRSRKEKNLLKVTRRKHQGSTLLVMWKKLFQRPRILPLQ